MAGNQSRGLVAASKTKGWDPTVIPDAGSLADFDVDQGNLAKYPLGNLGNPPNGWPNGYDVNVNAPASSTPDVPPIKTTYPESPFRETWDPPVLREAQNHRTTNANPFPAMPGVSKGR